MKKHLKSQPMEPEGDAVEGRCRYVCTGNYTKTRNTPPTRASTTNQNVPLTSATLLTQIGHHKVDLQKKTW
jgi:hypothetical protein